MSSVKIYICTNSRNMERSCKGAGSDKLIPILHDELSKRGYDNIELIESTCFGKCSTGPTLRIAGGPFFSKVKKESIPDVVETILQHITLDPQ